MPTPIKWRRQNCKGACKKKKKRKAADQEEHILLNKCKEITASASTQNSTDMNPQYWRKKDSILCSILWSLKESLRNRVRYSWAGPRPSNVQYPASLSQILFSLCNRFLRLWKVNIQNGSSKQVLQSLQCLLFLSSTTLLSATPVPRLQFPEPARNSWGVKRKNRQAYHWQ